MYRPKDWENPYEEDKAVFDGEYADFEDGASAMLEGLRKDLLEQWGIVITDEGKIFIPIKGNDV